MTISIPPREAMQEYLEKHGFRCRSQGDSINVSDSTGKFLVQFVIHSSARDLTPTDIGWLMRTNGVVGVLRKKNIANLSPVRIRMNSHPNLDPTVSPPTKKTRRSKKK